jgi:hypothetical protein
MIEIYHFVSQLAAIVSIARLVIEACFFTHTPGERTDLLFLSSSF